jgi:hypothetical protein
MTGRRLPAALAAVCATVTVAACSAGTSGPPGRISVGALNADLRAAMRSASSVYVTGNIVEANRTLGLSVGVLRSGQLAGTIIDDGVPIELIATRGRVYVKGTPAFLKGLRLPLALCRTVCGKYLQMPPGKAAGLVGDLSLPALTSLLTSHNAKSVKARLSRSHLDGVPTYRLRTSAGGIVQITQSAPHYPVSVISPGRRTGVLTFSDWNKVPAPRPPPSSEVVRGR